MEEPREQLNECNGEPGISSSDEEEEEEGEYIGYQRLDLAGGDVVVDGRESDHDEEGLEGYVMLARDEDSSEREQKVATTVQDRDGRGRQEEPVRTPAAPMGDEQATAIKQAMAGFSLPPSSVPGWAREVPESVWKQELLQGLRTQTRPPHPNS